MPTVMPGAHGGRWRLIKLSPSWSVAPLRLVRAVGHCLFYHCLLGRMYSDSDRVSTSRLRHDLVKGGCMCPLKTELELNKHHASASLCCKEGQGIVARPYLGAKLCLGLKAIYCGL